MVKDHIVQTADRLVIEPIFEHGFAEGSYGFRPGRGCPDALREVDRLIKEGFTHVVDADLAAYFDSIPHDALMAQVEAKVIDGGVLDLIRGWFKADILKGLERWTPTCRAGANPGRRRSGSRRGVLAARWTTGVATLSRAYFQHFRHIMLQHVLDAVPQRCR